MTKYAIADGAGYLSLDGKGSYPFSSSLNDIALYDSQATALRDLQEHTLSTGFAFWTLLRLVRVDEVAHAGDTKEVKRQFSAPEANGTISTRYEIDTHCARPNVSLIHRGDIIGVIQALTDKNWRCAKCGVYTVEAIDTVQLPPYTTRVASELK